MSLFDHSDRHRLVTIERSLLVILETQERTMAGLADLQAAVAELTTQLSANNAAIDALAAKLAGATSDADLEAIAAQIKTLIAANQAEVAKITPSSS